MLHAITVHPNWAYAFLHFGKRIENREFFPDKLIGRRLALHAGKHAGGAPSKPATFRGFRDLAHCMVRSGYLACPVWLKRNEPHLAWLEGTDSPQSGFHVVYEHDLPTSAVFAVATLDVAGEMDVDGWAFDGCAHWLMRDLLPLEQPVPCSGQQGIWKLPEEVEEAVRSQLPSREVHS